MNRDDFNHLLANANSGKIEAVNKLHDLYATQDFTFKNFTKADIDHYLSLPDDSYTLFHIAYLICIFDKNVERTKEYLIKSIDKGCSQAYVLLALLVDYDVIEYESTFDELIKKSVKMKNSNAYIEQAGKLNGEKKIKLIKDAIKLGNRNGYHELGLHYHDSKKYKLAKKYYEKSIESGIHASHFNLGVMYREGEGVTKDPERAMKLFKTARKHGCNRAATTIGGMYLDKGNYDAAKKYLVEAMDNGDPMACYNLGLLHKMNDDIYEAMKCFVQGAIRGHEASKREAIMFGIHSLNITDHEIKQMCDLYEKTRHFGANDYY
uniref:Sel1 repeat family protein n=1 Tax=viral metagenome TaxID=1070528 RepID=A0A6C0CAC3_9ZZZZ